MKTPSGIEGATKRLKQIDSEIREFLPGIGWREPGYNKRLRSLTKAEWEEIQVIAEEHSFPCQLIPGPYSFGLSVHEHSDIPGVQTDMLLYVEYWQFPFVEKGGATQEKAARIAAKITHTERNKQVLEWYKFPELCEPAHYAY